MRVLMQIGPLPDEPIEFVEVNTLLVLFDDGTPMFIGDETGAPNGIACAVWRDKDFQSRLRSALVQQLARKSTVPVPSEVQLIVDKD